jgi:hypothetical protein
MCVQEGLFGGLVGIYLALMAENGLQVVKNPQM